MQRIRGWVVIDHAVSGDNELIAGIAGRYFVVTNFCLVAVGAVTVRFESGAGGTALTGVMSLAANQDLAPGHNPDGHFMTAKGDALNLELGGAVSVDGWLNYDEIDTGTAT